MSYTCGINRIAKRVWIEEGFDLPEKGDTLDITHDPHPTCPDLLRQTVVVTGFTCDFVLVENFGPAKRADKRWPYSFHSVN